MEHNKLEYKSIWKDEYLETVCAFANTRGGVLEIGKNDVGEVVGISNAKELLDLIPKKIFSTMMISADVSLNTENGKEYISINVMQHPFPIAYRGKYYGRSGSNTIELTGNGLSELMLRAQGKTWDGLPIPNVSADDLYANAYKTFRKKALNSKRLNKEDVEIPDDALLENLELKENGFLKRAAVMCFGENPEKWVTEAYIMIGYFDNDVDLRYQDEVHGPLIELADKTLDLLYTKYFKGIIHYEGIQRVEVFPVPYEAMREAVLNSIIHNDYSHFNPIRIRVYENKVVITNMAKFPEHISFEELITSHTSRPHNPNIARTFYKSGQIERWGRGINKIITECKNEGKPEPQFKSIGSFFQVTFENDVNYVYMTDKTTDKMTDKNSNREKQIIGYLLKNEFISNKAACDLLGVSDTTAKRLLKRMTDKRLLAAIGERKTRKYTLKK